jgi:hypothetical protein
MDFPCQSNREMFRCDEQMDRAVLAMLCVAFLDFLCYLCQQPSDLTDDKYPSRFPWYLTHSEYKFSSVFFS